MLLTLLIFLVMLSILVMVHEIGHFTAAKKFGIKVEEFGFGLPPRLWGKKIGETIYSINWLPIGGFVKLYGEDSEGDGAQTKKKTSDSGRAFYAQPLWKRSVVLVAGVAMNFLLAVVIISYLFTQGVMVPVERVHVDQVDPGSPAEEAGIKPNDVIVSVNGQPVIKADEFTSQVKSHLGEPVTVALQRGASLVHYGEKLTSCDNCTLVEVKLTPRKDPPVREVTGEKEQPDMLSQWWSSFKQSLGITPKVKPEEAPPKQGPIGVVISSYEKRIYPWYQAPFYGTWESMKLSWELAKGIGITVWKLVSFQSVSQEVAGPVGIAQMTGQARRIGIMALLELTGLLSLNLAIVNILPFPALDGGRLLFVVLEGITGRKLRSTWERYVHQIGMIILLTLILLITINDIVKLFTQ